MRNAKGGIGGPGLGFVSIVPAVLCSLGAGCPRDLWAAAPWVVAIAIFAPALGLSFAWIRDPLQAEA